MTHNYVASALLAILVESAQLRGEDVRAFLATGPEAAARLNDGETRTTDLISRAPRVRAERSRKKGQNLVHVWAEEWERRTAVTFRQKEWHLVVCNRRSCRQRACKNTRKTTVDNGIRLYVQMR